MEKNEHVLEVPGTTEAYKKRWIQLADEIENSGDIEVTLKLNKRIYQWLEECVKNGTFKTVSDAINYIVMFVWNTAEHFGMRQDNLKNAGEKIPLDVKEQARLLKIKLKEDIKGGKKDEEGTDSTVG